MATLERTSSTSSLIDVLDRVLDKGIVIDAWVRVSLIGIELVTVEARVVVASIATYLGYADTLAELRQPGAQASPAPPSARVFRTSAPPFGVDGHP
jgi:hypothetical protein